MHKSEYSGDLNNKAHIFSEKYALFKCCVFQLVNWWSALCLLNKVIVFDVFASASQMLEK